MPEAPLILRYAARSDVGRLRSKNDDSAYAGRHLMVVADGMGGHAGGDVASASTVLDLIHLDHGGYEEGEAATQLADEIQTANSLLSELVSANPLLAGMGTTVTALLLSEGTFAFAHIGDSRAYRLRGNDIEQVSTDHTFVQRLINEGRLRPEEAETHPHKNVLMRVLGDVDASPELDLATFPAVEGERWLLCSDGLNYVPLPLVHRTLREIEDPAECADRLVELTLAAGAPDNVTVIVADVVAGEDDGEAAPPAQAPAAASLTAAAAARTPVTSAAAANPPRAKASEQPAAEEAPATEPAPAASPEPAAAEAGAAPAPEGGGEDAGREEPETDPNLGAHLSAEVLRRELDSRPHELVGAAASAAETGSLPSVASRTAARRAAAILTHRSPEPEEDADEPTPPARPVRRWFRIGLGAIAALALILGVWFGYAWTQTRYYVGAYDNRVAIYNGVSQQLGPISLSHVHSATNIPLDSLSPYTQQRLHSGVPADGLEAAEDIVHAIQADPRGCLPGSGATASAAPSSTAAHGASPSASAKPSASGSAAPSGSPSASPTTTPDPCLGGTR
ncbi:PP2C family protein-serine/threonine phosphatase [Sinomonas soli]